MFNQPISQVDSHKHLGIHLTDTCTWKNHIDYIKEKAWLRINIMRRLKFTLSRTTLQTIYMTFIRPVLEYGDVIWDNCTQNDKYELDKIQHEAARIVTGATKLVSINELYQDIGWESLETRRRKHKLCLFYKMVNGLTPDYLSSLVPPNVGSTNRYSLRNE